MGFPSGFHRYCYDLLLTETNTTPSEVATGRVTPGTKEKAGGGAAGRAGGVYTGLSELEWVVEIYDVTDGTSIALAKYRYSKDGGKTWVATGTTAASVTLELGVQFFFTAAVSGADFAKDDRWRFKTLLPHAMAAALDYQDRNLTYRTKDAAGTKTHDVDHGAAKTMRAFILFDHNLTGAATVTVKLNSTPSWGAPPVSEAIAHAAGTMGKFFTGGSYRYARIELADAGNAAGYLQHGKLFLGDYLELANHKRSTAPWDRHREPHMVVAKAEASGYRRASVRSAPEVFPVHYGYLTPAEYDALVVMRDACWNATTQLDRPLIVVPDHTAPAQAFLCWLEAFDLRGTKVTGYAGDLILREVVKL